MSQNVTIVEFLRKHKILTLHPILMKHNMTTVEDLKALTKTEADQMLGQKSQLLIDAVAAECNHYIHNKQQQSNVNKSSASSNSRFPKSRIHMQVIEKMKSEKSRQKDPSVKGPPMASYRFKQNWAVGPRFPVGSFYSAPQSTAPYLVIPGMADVRKKGNSGVGMKMTSDAGKRMEKVVQPPPTLLDVQRSLSPPLTSRRSHTPHPSYRDTTPRFKTTVPEGLQVNLPITQEMSDQSKRPNVGVGFRMTGDSHCPTTVTPRVGAILGKDSQSRSRSATSYRSKSQEEYFGSRSRTPYDGDVLTMLEVLSKIQLMCGTVAAFAEKRDEEKTFILNSIGVPEIDHKVVKDMLTDNSL